MSAESYKRLFSRSLAAAPGRLHFAAHSHHLWPDASYEGHLDAWEDAALLADKKWDKVFAEVIPEAQSHVAEELRLPDPSTIAFAPNTHDFLTRIVSARGEKSVRILSSDGEFHSFRRQTARWAEDGRVTLDVVPTEPMESFSKRFSEAMTKTAPDIAFVSHVMFESGLVFNHAAELAALTRPDGAWVVLDLYHSFMAMPLDFTAIADRVFLLGGGYKYAMAGEGCAYLHAPRGFAPRPALTGWYAEFAALERGADAVGYGRDGSRFLGATFDPSGLYRFNAVRRMLDAEGLTTAAITKRTAKLRAELAQRIAAGEAGTLREADILAPPQAQQRFLALRHPRAAEWKARLMDADIITDARDDVLRIGLGLYHDPEDIETFCARARAALA